MISKKKRNIGFQKVQLNDLKLSRLAEGWYSSREVVEIDGIPINLISLQDLKKNKRAAGRHKDMEDIEHLP